MTYILIILTRYTTEVAKKILSTNFAIKYYKILRGTTV